MDHRESAPYRDSSRADLPVVGPGFLWPLFHSHLLPVPQKDLSENLKTTPSAKKDACLSTNITYMKRITAYLFSFQLALSAMHAFGQPVYKDLPYRQGYSIKYEILRSKDPPALPLHQAPPHPNPLVQPHPSAHPL